MHIGELESAPKCKVPSWNSCDNDDLNEMMVSSAETERLHLIPNHRLSPQQLGCEPLPWCAGQQYGWRARQEVAAAVTHATCSETSKAASAISAEGGGVWGARPAVSRQSQLLPVPTCQVPQVSCLEQLEVGLRGSRAKVQPS